MVRPSGRFSSPTRQPTRQKSSGCSTYCGALSTPQTARLLPRQAVAADWLCRSCLTRETPGQPSSVRLADRGEGDQLERAPSSAPTDTQAPKFGEVLARLRLVRDVL